MVHIVAMVAFWVLGVWALSAKDRMGFLVCMAIANVWAATL